MRRYTDNRPMAGHVVIVSGNTNYLIGRGDGPIDDDWLWTTDDRRAYLFTWADARRFVARHLKYMTSDIWLQGDGR